MQERNQNIITVRKNPLIPYGWLRVILYLAFIVGGLLALSKLANLLIPAFDISNAKSSKAGISVVDINIWLSVLISFITILICTWVFRTYIDRRSLHSLGFKWSGFENHALTGFFLAPAMLGVGTLLLVAMKYLRFSGAVPDGSFIIINIGLMLLVAVSEELLFRGYVLNNLLQSMNKWIALGAMALLFTLFHAGNPGVTPLALAEVFIGGVMLGVNYIYTRNLWFGIFLHFAWNFFQGPVLGYNVSGMNLEPVLQQSMEGPEALTGGAFGFEGSVISMALNILVIIVLVLVYERKGLAATSLKPNSSS